MDPIWLKNYLPGVPPDIILDPAESLVDLLETACRRFADRPAYSNFGHTISFGELDHLSRRFAGFLQHELGLAKGERLAIMLPNLLQFPVAFFGALRAGLVAVNVNPLYTPRELAHQLKDSGATAIVAVTTAGAVLAEALRQGSDIRHVILTEMGDLLPFPRRQLVNFVVRRVRRMVRSFNLPTAISFRQAMEHGREPDAVALEASDLACLQYTGGTTGVSRGAMLSHGNLLANVYQINTWFGDVVRPGEEVVVTALPLYHVYALTCNGLAYTQLGGHNILITDPRDIPGFIRELKRWKFTAMTGVNTLYQHLANHPSLAEVDFSHLKIVSAGGMAVMESTARRWAEVTGTEILEGYGLSEASPVVTSNRPDLASWSGSIGLPLPGTKISLRDDDDVEVAPGEPGEICVKGPQVMQGYWRNDEATRDVMTSDGFLRTGDIAVMDEGGYMRIVDRKKDMISVSGLKAYPNEIEKVVTMHPSVLEAAAVGVPDERSREAIKVFVVLRGGQRATVDEIRSLCRDNLAAYKVPKYVEFRESLPKSNVGKILRRQLREEALAAAASG